MTKIVITYPPDFDGELHIEAEECKGLSETSRSWKFQFEHAARTEDVWTTLVAAAKAILAQEVRRNPSKY
jgi:hypothetical protein